MEDVLSRLEAWYAAQCDGDWEHEFGIRIENIDNTGWRVKIPLEGTELEERSFTPISDRAGADDWMFCRVRDLAFEGSCGTRRLSGLLDVFLRWAESADEQGRVSAG